MAPRVPPVASLVFGRTPAFWAIALLAALTLVRLRLAAHLPLLPDEAYYFQWARHLDASYFSKGPAIAYTIATGTWLFGPTPFGVRFFAVLLSAGTGWQLFLLACHWFDDRCALLALLIAVVVPIFAVGAVVMTIDPLSAFFWLWAANWFSRALDSPGYLPWLATGFAVGCGFLAKYLNALELLAFALFLLASPPRRACLRRPPFWSMLAVFAVCILPVVAWNAHHGWSSVAQLEDRARLTGTFPLAPRHVFDFFLQQMVVVSPLLFLALFIALGRAGGLLFRASPAEGREREGYLLLGLLFATVFGFYALLSWHLKQEPNWPVVSYLSAFILLAHCLNRVAARGGLAVFFAVALTGAAVETWLLHDPAAFGVPARLDPLNRTRGWREVAQALAGVQERAPGQPVVVDAYKEASILSFYLPGQPFVYVRRSWPPRNQYDFWPTYPPETGAALWVCEGNQKPDAQAFPTSRAVARVEVWIESKRLRDYTFFQCTRP